MIASVDEASRLFRSEIPQDRLVILCERLYSTPRLIRCDTTGVEGAVKNRFEHSEDAVGCCFTFAPGVIIVRRFPRRRLVGSPLGSDPLRAAR